MTLLLMHLLFMFALTRTYTEKYDTFIAMPFHLFLCLQNGYLHGLYTLRTLFHTTWHFSLFVD